MPKSRGKGIGPMPIIAVAIVSATLTIILDHYGVTTWVQHIAEKIARH